MRSSALAAIAALLAAAPARAETVDATLTTLLAGHQEPRDGKVYTVVPVYESVSLQATGLENPWVDDLKLVVAGWGMAAEGRPRDGQIADGDLDLGYAEGKLIGRHLDLRLGRQLVVGGAARVTQLDGLVATARIWRGLGATAYGGVPVTPRFATSRGDAVGGARAFYRYSYDTEIGLSFIHQMGEGRVFRQDLGADARFRPLRTLDFTGAALFSLKESRLAEAGLSASWAPVAPLELTADYRRTAPDLFLPRNSIFAVFSEETRDEVGGTVWLRPIARIRLTGDYHAVLDASGLGHRGGGRLLLTLGRERQTSIGAELRALKLPADGYTQARLFGSHRVAPSLAVTLDGDAYLLDRPINGQTFSFTAAGTVGWDFAAGWRAVLALFGDVTPFVERRFEVIAKLVWQPTLRVREVRP